MYRITWEAFSNNSSSTVVKCKVETSVSVYRDRPVALFSIIYTSGLTDAAIPGTGSQTLSTYPSFVIEEIPDMNRAYLTWIGGRKYCL
jgi:hypothetical protein